MIDSHAHLYAEVFEQDLDQVIARAKEVGMDKIILANADCESLPKLLKVCEQYPEMCVPSIGLHPTDIKVDYLDQLKTLHQALQERSDYVAIGEIGLDLYWDQTFLAEQKKALRTQFEWAVEKDLPVILHIRDAFEAFYEVMEESQDLPLRGVVHSFSGDEEDVARIKNYGEFYFGINGIATFKNSQMDGVIKAIGLDRILLETDAPFLAPVPKRGKRNEPAFVAYVADKISDILEVETTIVVQATDENAKKLFSL